MPLLVRKAFASCSSSLTLTPRKSTPRPLSSAATCWNSGVSTRQGGHHEPQKLITATLPSSVADRNRPPSSSVPENDGAEARFAPGITVPGGVPATNRNSPPLLTSTAACPVAQPVSTS